MFTQDDLNTLEVKTDTGAEITIYFQSGDAEYVDIDGAEFYVADDVLKNLFVKVRDQFYTLLQIVQNAESNYDDICEETRREIEIEERMCSELSSPYLTGRI